MSIQRSTPDSTVLSFPQARLVDTLQALDGPRRRQVQAAANTLIDCLQDFSDRGQVPLAATVTVDGPAAPCLWQQYRGNGASPLGSRPQSLFYFYHSHAVSGALPQEHGHFHLFAQLEANEDEKPQYTHIVAIGVDARGLPLRLFTTNRWVTGETWLAADRVIGMAERIAANTMPAADMSERWLQSQMGVFAPQIAALLRHRDQRINDRLARGGRPGLLEDRRMHVLSQCRVSVEEQLTAFDHAIH